MSSASLDWVFSLQGIDRTSKLVMLRLAHEQSLAELPFEPCPVQLAADCGLELDELCKHLDVLDASGLIDQLIGRTQLSAEAGDHAA